MQPRHFKVTPDIHASKEQRFLNLIIDRVLFFGLFYCVVFVMAYVVYNYTTNTKWFDDLVYEIEKMNRLMDYIFSGLVFALFYSLCETLLRGRTIGKYITKTKVVNEKGQTVGASDIIIRSLCRMIPFNGFSFLRDDARGWHDSLSNTYVVDMKKFQAKIETEKGLEEIGKTTNF